ncbi:MAG: glyoxalase [Frankiales bacterium]|nr:glyoxalase [Frankiales bacterium]
MIGRIHQVVIDCPDPFALARFYSALLGQPITYASDDWVVVSDGNIASGLAFQLAPDHQPPRWPDPNHPQQFHLDVMVSDLDAADGPTLALGAVKLDGGRNVDRTLNFQAYADPAGHPFCLVPRPPSAAAI